jgi:hypothetical protein
MNRAYRIASTEDSGELVEDGPAADHQPMADKGERMAGLACVKQIAGKPPLTIFVRGVTIE